VYIVLGTIKVKPEHLDEFVDNVRRHAANSLREPGCLRYDVLQDLTDPTSISLYEVFRSEADLDFHHAQDYYKDWMTMSRDWRDVSSYTRRVLRNVFPED
jgi:quinol monooxygenase YgiN